MILCEGLVEVDFVVTVLVRLRLLKHDFMTLGILSLLLHLPTDALLQEDCITRNFSLVKVSLLLDYVRIWLQNMDWLLLVLFQGQD